MARQMLPFADVVVDVSGGNTKTPQSAYLSSGELPVVDQGQALVGGYTNELGAAFKGELPVIVFGDHTRVLKLVDFAFGMGADGVKVLKPKADIDIRYLYHFLRTLSLPNAGYSRHFKFLKETSIPVVALDEQVRIAHILDSADILREKRRASLQLLDNLKGAIFVEMFGDPLANPQGFGVSKLAELGEVSTGRTPPGGTPGLFGDEIPFVTPGDLETDKKPARFLSVEGAKSVRTVRTGATFVCCIGTVGKTGLASQRSAFNQQINAVEWYPTVNDIFGYMSLRLQRDKVASAATSTTLPILKKSLFEKLEIPVPLLELQVMYSQRYALVAALGRELHRDLEQLDCLVEALRQHAFAGGFSDSMHGDGAKESRGQL